MTARTAVETDLGPAYADVAPAVGHRRRWPDQGPDGADLVLLLSQDVQSAAHGVNPLRS